MKYEKYMEVGKETIVKEFDKDFVLNDDVNKAYLETLKALGNYVNVLKINGVKDFDIKGDILVHFNTMLLPMLASNVVTKENIRKLFSSFVEDGLDTGLYDFGE